MIVFRFVPLRVTLALLILCPSLVHQETGRTAKATRDEIEEMTEASQLLERLVSEKLLTQYQPTTH